MLVKYRKIAEFFEAAIDGIQNPKTVANLIIGQIFRRMENDSAKEQFETAITPQQLKELVLLLEGGKIRMNLLKSTLEQMLDTGKSAGDLISESDMGGIDEATLKKLCEESIAGNPNAVNDYKNGKEKALKALLGNVMRATRGRADAQQAEQMLIELLK